MTAPPIPMCPGCGRPFDDCVDCTAGPVADVRVVARAVTEPPNADTLRRLADGLRNLETP